MENHNASIKDILFIDLRKKINLVTARFCQVSSPHVYTD